MEESLQKRFDGLREERKRKAEKRERRRKKRLIALVFFFFFLGIGRVDLSCAELMGKESGLIPRIRRIDEERIAVSAFGKKFVIEPWQSEYF